MKLKDKIFSKIRAKAMKTYKKAAPIVRKEIEKTVVKGKDDIVFSVLDGVEALVLGAIMISIVAKPNGIFKVSSNEPSRNIYNIYNEVNVTNNFYSKGDI